MIDTINVHTILSAQIVQYDTLGVLFFSYLICNALWFSAIAS